MIIHQYTLKTGISRTPGFEKKKLASLASNVAIKCGHGYLYYSPGAMLRMHKAFAETSENPFGHNYTILDLNNPERASKDARHPIHDPDSIERIVKFGCEHPGFPGCSDPALAKYCQKEQCFYAELRNRNKGMTSNVQHNQKGSS
jgi:hypothetical protein